MPHEVKITQTANSNLQNEINVSIIFNYLRSVKTSYRAQISKELNISAPAVSRAIENLIEHGYVIETEKMPAQSGKKVSKLMPNIYKGHVIGIDLMKEHLKISMFNYIGEMIDSCSGMKVSASKDVVNDLINEIDTFIASAEKKITVPPGAAIPKLDAICIGIPAVIDTASGKRLNNAILFSNLQDINLKQVLSDYYKVPVYAEKDGNLSALGEKIYGQGKHYSNLVFIEVSSGIGTGIVLDGKLFRGAHNYSGELGHTVIGTENIGVRFRTKGYLEQFASTESIADMAATAMSEGRQTLIYDLTGGDPSRITPAAVCEAALQGDQTASEILRKISKMLSVAIINMILIIDPEIVVIGGVLCSLPGIEDLLIKPVRESVKASLPFIPPEIVISSLGDDAAVIGASYMATESLLLGKYPYRM